MITVRPIGGLANRMRVIAATVELAERNGSSLRCLWVSNSELGACFTDLFKVSPRFSVSSKNEGKLISSFKTDRFKSVVAKIWNKSKGYDYYYSAGNVNALASVSGSYDYRLFFNTIEPLVAAGKDICFVSGNYLADLQDLSMFEPVASIQNEIDAFSQHFDNHTYGLHVRRTDNTWAIERSPLALFCKVVEDNLAEDPLSKFYLSTDDLDTSSFLLDKFGDAVIVRPKCYGRDSLEAMRDAVTDMWLLSKTNHIYGSFYSSFSEMAALIGQCPLSILRNK